MGSCSPLCLARHGTVRACESFVQQESKSVIAPPHLLMSQLANVHNAPTRQRADGNGRTIPGYHNPNVDTYSPGPPGRLARLKCAVNRGGDGDTLAASATW